MAGDRTTSMSRREMVGGTATLAAASLTSATAKGRETMAANSTPPEPLVDPQGQISEAAVRTPVAALGRPCEQDVSAA